MIGSRQIGADVLPAQLQDAERDWRAAARRATEASYRYHLVRVLGAAARRALVDERSQLRPPLWAVALRNWEGALDDGAARRAGMACFQASRDFHLASARRELLRARLARHRGRTSADAGQIPAPSEQRTSRCDAVGEGPGAGRLN